MKRYIFVLITFLGYSLTCFSQAKIDATAGVTLINTDDFLKKYQGPPLENKKDSLLAIEASMQNNLIPINIEVGMEKNTILKILGSPTQKIIISNKKEKWLYNKKYIFFINGRVDFIFNKK